MMCVPRTTHHIQHFVIKSIHLDSLPIIMPRNTRNNQYPDAAPPAKRQTRSTSSSLTTRGRSAPGIDIGKKVETTPTKQINVSTNDVSGKVDVSNDQPKFTIASILKDHDDRISKEN